MASLPSNMTRKFLPPLPAAQQRGERAQEAERQARRPQQQAEEEGQRLRQQATAAAADAPAPQEQLMQPKRLTKWDFMKQAGTPPGAPATAGGELLTADGLADAEMEDLGLGPGC